MTLRNFLRLHQDGVAMWCVSIHGYTETYLEEEYQEEIEESEIFKTIRNMQVDHFCIIGGFMGSPVELCIYLKGEEV